MPIGEYEPGIVVVDVPSLGLCRLTPAEARAYIDLFETGASAEELEAWANAAFDRRDEEAETTAMPNRSNGAELGAGMSAATFPSLAKDAKDRVPAEAAKKPRHEAEVYDPAAFASQVVGSMVAHYDELIDPTAAKYRAEYTRARDALEAHPCLLDVPHDHPLNLADEAVWAWTNAMFDAGVRVGAQIEHLRRTWKG